MQWHHWLTANKRSFESPSPRCWSFSEILTPRESFSEFTLSENSQTGVLLFDANELRFWIFLFQHPRKNVIKAWEKSFGQKHLRPTMAKYSNFIKADIWHFIFPGLWNIIMQIDIRWHFYNSIFNSNFHFASISWRRMEKRTRPGIQKFTLLASLHIAGKTVTDVQ